MRNIEALAAKVHQAYLDTCDRLGWEVSEVNRVPYAELSEASKELDRATVCAATVDLETRLVESEARNKQTLCIGCGNLFSREGLTPQQALEQIAMHISKCEGHPLHKAIEEIERLKGALGDCYDESGR